MAFPSSLIALVVEDDAFVRLDLTAILEDVGCQVHYSATAEEALLLLEAHDEIDCLLSDIDLGPGMTGYELAGIVRERWPDTRITLISGRRPTEPDGGAVVDRFIGKPFSPAAVLEAIS